MLDFSVSLSSWASVRASFSLMAMRALSASSRSSEEAERAGSPLFDIFCFLDGGGWRGREGGAGPAAIAFAG